MNEMDRQAIRNLQERVGKLERELNQSKRVGMGIESI